MDIGSGWTRALMRRVRRSLHDPIPNQLPTNTLPKSCAQYLCTSLVTLEGSVVMRADARAFFQQPVSWAINREELGDFPSFKMLRPGMVELLGTKMK